MLSSTRLVSSGVVLAVLAAALAAGCNRANPLYHGHDGGAATGAATLLAPDLISLPQPRQNL